MRRLLAIVTTLTIGSTPVAATPLLMSKLPAANPFRCLNCHVVQDPPASGAALNPFGQDFKNNRSVWDRVLVQKQSDGDNCTNGFEIGDEDGNGRLERNVNAERHNPGEMDCALQLNSAAWTALKELFR